MWPRRTTSVLAYCPSDKSYDLWPARPRYVLTRDLWHAWQTCMLSLDNVTVWQMYMVLIDLWPGRRKCFRICDLFGRCTICHVTCDLSGRTIYCRVTYDLGLFIRWKVKVKGIHSDVKGLRNLLVSLGAPMHLHLLKLYHYLFEPTKDKSTQPTD